MGKFLTEEEKNSQPKVTPALLKRIFSYLMPYKLQLLMVLGCIVVSCKRLRKTDAPSGPERQDRMR